MCIAYNSTSSECCISSMIFVSVYIAERYPEDNMTLISFCLICLSLGEVLEEHPVYIIHSTYYSGKKYKLVKYCSKVHKKVKLDLKLLRNILPIDLRIFSTITSIKSRIKFVLPRGVHLFYINKHVLQDYYYCIILCI